MTIALIIPLMVADSIKALALKHHGLILSDARVKELCDEWERRVRNDDYERSIWLYSKLRELKKAAQ